MGATELTEDRKLVGKVTYKERDEILALFERKNGLIELTRALAEADDELLKNGHFYEKIIADLGKTCTRHEEWWGDRARHYQWERAEGHCWEIDFESGRIFLKKNS